MDRSLFIKSCKRVVIKCGSAVVTDTIGSIDKQVINNLAREISTLSSQNYKISLVTSGAVASGISIFHHKPKNIREKQAFASVGQILLMENYKKAFEVYNKTIAQILLTHEDFKSRKRFLHIKENIETLLNLSTVPIINENDSITVTEIKFGDNDQLSSLFAGLFNADLLILLTDIDGFYNSNPKHHTDSILIQSVKEINEDILKLAETTKSRLGTGGMISKLNAADRATGLGIPVIIANGKKENIITDILHGETSGTFFYPKKKRLKLKKFWLLHSTKAKGELIIDSGAVKAIKEAGKSLLPIGIVGLSGNFDEGDIVVCYDSNGQSIAKGIASYSSEDIKKIKGAESSKIKNILGYKYSDEVIHRNNMVLSK